ncbi:MAG: hypothetical protein WCY01_06150, partial [Alkalispirochaeta sp.]
MIDHTVTPRVSSWYSLSGPERDVAVVSQVSLNRNIVELPFVHLMKGKEFLDLRKRVETAIHALPGEYRLLDGETLTAPLREFYEDRGILVVGERAGVSAVSVDDTSAIRLGTADHLRLSGFSGGLDPERARERAVLLDQLMEQHLEYAVSLQLGYLSPDVHRVGTGLMGSVLLHLPALEHSEGLRLPEELRLPGGRSGDRITVHRYGSTENDKGSLYVVGYGALFGRTEDEVITELAEFTYGLVHYEQEARRELLRLHGEELADGAGRALGILRYARKLSSGEAMDLLSTVRLGVSLEVIDGVDLNGLTDALFVSRDSQVRVLEEKNDTVSTEAAS